MLCFLALSEDPKQKSLRCRLLGLVPKRAPVVIGARTVPPRHLPLSPWVRLSLLPSHSSSISAEGIPVIVLGNWSLISKKGTAKASE